jgi:5-methylcytosine-specific restriction endonuclease McrA
VFERDGWVCGICGDDVEPDDASLDHIVSMSNGGSHTYDNVQCAHTACNVRKGNRDGIAPVQSRDAALSR